MEQLLKTVFYEKHVSLGAKMVEFGGWDMPVQYETGIVQEHLNTRKQAGLFDVSHMGRFIVGGPDALDFLQHVLTNNAAALEIEESQYTMIPDADGFAVLGEGTNETLMIWRKQAEDKRERILAVQALYETVRKTGFPLIGILYWKLTAEANLVKETIDYLLLSAGRAVFGALRDWDAEDLAYAYMVNVFGLHEVWLTLRRYLNPDRAVVFGVASQMKDNQLLTNAHVYSQTKKAVYDLMYVLLRDTVWH